MKKFLQSPAGDLCRQAGSRDAGRQVIVIHAENLMNPAHVSTKTAGTCQCRTILRPIARSKWGPPHAVGCLGNVPRSSLITRTPLRQGSSVLAWVQLPSTAAHLGAKRYGRMLG